MRAFHRRVPKAMAAFFLAAASGVVTMSAANAATFSVTRNDDPAPDGCAPADCSLREAVMAANAAPGADTIVLQPGVYTLTISSLSEPATVVDPAVGDLDVTDALTIDPVDGGAVIDAGMRFTFGAFGISVTTEGTGGRVVHAVAPLTLHDVTLTGGGPYGQNGAGLLVDGTALEMHGGGATRNADDLGCCGGGIAVLSGSATLERVSITENSVDRCCGGGLYVGSSTVSFVDGEVRRNHAWDCCGAGVYVTTDDATGRVGGLTLQRSTIGQNEAHVCCGGGLYVSSDDAGGTTVDMTAVDVQSNAVLDDCCGGGIYLEPGTQVAMRRSSVTSNSTTTCCGAGIYNEGTFTFEDGAIVGNSMPECCGGGLMTSLAGSHARLENATVSGNEAPAPDPNVPSYTGGGGIWASEGTLELSHVTVTNNAGTPGGSGIANGDTAGTLAKATISVDRSIVAGNPPGPQCRGPVTSLGYNISSDASCGFTAPSDRPNTDPALEALSGTGASLAHAPASSSVAIDAIPQTDCTSSTDQRGTARPQDRAEVAGVGCDIGAIEMPGNVVATPTPTPTPTVTATPTPTARPKPTPTPTATGTGAPSSPPVTPTPTPAATASPGTTATPSTTPTPTPEPIDPRCDDEGVICGTDGSETIIGTDEGELIICGDGDDGVRALGGDDTIECGDEGDDGDKDIEAGAGDDDVDCNGTGNDEVFGGAGDDEIRCGDGGDFLRGGKGADVLVSLGDGDLILGGGGRDRIRGGGGGDSLFGGARRDFVSGGRGSDGVYGQGGRDTLRGGPGHDRCDDRRREDVRGCEAKGVPQP